MYTTRLMTSFALPSFIRSFHTTSWTGLNKRLEFNFINHLAVSSSGLNCVYENEIKTLSILSNGRGTVEHRPSLDSAIDVTSPTSPTSPTITGQNAQRFLRRQVSIEGETGPQEIIVRYTCMWCLTCLFLHLMFSWSTSQVKIKIKPCS